MVVQPAPAVVLGDASSSASLPATSTGAAGAAQAAVPTAKGVSKAETAAVHVEQAAEHAERVISAFASWVDGVNMPLYQRLNDDMSTAMNNTKNIIAWERVNSRGPRKGPVTPDNPIVGVYVAPSPFLNICAIVNISLFKHMRYCERFCL